MSGYIIHLTPRRPRSGPSGRASPAVWSGSTNFLDSADCRTDEFSMEGMVITCRKESTEMKRALLVLTAIVASAAMTGCCLTNSLTGSCANAPENCASCGETGGETCGEICGDPSNCESTVRDPNCRVGRVRRSAAASGPPTGTIAYPYYTTRAPRDFLVADPPSIGP